MPDRYSAAMLGLQDLTYRIGTRTLLDHATASVPAGAHAAQRRPCAGVYGDWRMRVARAATLFAEPALLLLDEPTDYLDLEATLWLEEHIARYPHAVLVISHDRDLLDNAVDWILHLEA